MEIQLDDLKCCGNCTHRTSIDMGSEHEESCKKNYNTPSYMKCDEWEYDKLKWSDRV